MADKDGKTLSEGDKILWVINLSSEVKLKRTGEIRHIIRNKKTGNEIALVTIDRNILGNLFPVCSDRIKKLKAGD